MPSGGYFLKLTGAVLLGLVTLAIAAVLVFLLAPYIIPFFVGLLPFLVGTLVFIVAVIVVWVIIYVAAVIGIALYYVIMHPMTVSQQPGTYSLDKAKEAGMREQGDTKKKKKGQKK